MKKLILILVLVISMVVGSACNNTKETTDPVNYEAEINKEDVMSFDISVDEEQWQTMLDNAQAEEYIPADVTINGTTIKNVGIRPKGNSSLKQVASDDTTDRYSFRIKFDEYVDGQTWMGLDRIVVNNMFSDPSYLKEYLSYDIMEYVGVDVPLFAFADISVNDTTWGFYLAIEDTNGSSYLDRVYDGDGQLYKPSNDEGQNGENMKGINNKTVENSEIDENSEAGVTGNTENNQLDDNRAGNSLPEGNINMGGGMAGMAENGVSLEYEDDESSSYSAIFNNAKTKAEESDYQRVITALKNLNEGTDLETYVDVEAVLKYFAAHTVVVNLDSYVSNMGHNYYLYENNGQISILPWDYNLSFGGFLSGNATDVINFPIDTPVSGISMEERPLLNKLLEVPEYLEMYHTYLQEIMDGYFSDGKWDSKIESLNNLIKEYVKNDPTAFYTYEEYETSVSSLKELGNLRAESIQGQLAGTIPSTTQEQEADASTLIDGSGIDLSTLGTQGGNGMQGGPFGGQGNFNFPEGVTMEVLRSARDIIGDTTYEELTQEQLEQLQALGLTEEQIEEITNMQIPNQPNGNMPNGAPSSENMPNGELPNGELPNGEPPSGDIPDMGSPEESTTGADSQ